MTEPESLHRGKSIYIVFWELDWIHGILLGTFVLRREQFDIRSRLRNELKSRA